MEITIIILTIIYFILVMIANYMSHCDSVIRTKYENKYLNKPTKFSIIENVCRVISYAILIINVAFILAFFF